ncbi:hypothetical protein YTPLAS18_13060 [Nitrospira sp.]|nr:hypothetical protein YTPLAS18_13060 [Nitrospira sp.]
MQKQGQKQAYAEPVLVKREQLRDVTAGNGVKYREKLLDKFSDVPL